MKLKIIVFDDNPEHDEVVGALRTALGDRGEVHLFEHPQDVPREGMYEERICEILKRDPYRDAHLIVADRDLSATEGLQGLSESTVKRVADKLVIPECAYARDAQLETELFESAERREARIVVSLRHGLVRFSEQVVDLVDGFSAILARLPEAKKMGGRKSPGRLLAAILGKPEYADKISLYAAGDQNRVGSVLAVKSPEPDQRIVCLLGYWLWDSILRYPGVVVNAVAAASYLNIATKEFARNEVQEIFSEARYAGPFATAKEPLWWRGVLDDLVSGAACADGREFVAQAREVDVEEVEPSQCCEDPNLPAGYYCMLSHRPVSLENSHPGLSWFPRGADLARICRSKFDEEVPWITG